jgi:prepilin-type N-terminal cleavage/methylation domain-containing protein
VTEAGERRGFTLLELVVVMAIVAVLATVGFAAAGRLRTMAQGGALRE